MQAHLDHDDLTEYCPCAKPLHQIATVAAQIAFARPCMYYGSIGRTCTIRGRCNEADKVERRIACDLTKCPDYEVKS